LTALFLLVGCGGSPASGSTTPAEGGQGDQGAAGAAVDRGEQPAGAEHGPAAASGEQGPAESAAIPTDEGDCVEYHLKVLECSTGGQGLSEKAVTRQSIEQGCLTAIEDRDNPVAAFVLGLWARCKELPCPDLEACFESGMAELAAPPGPYLPAPQ
jgi:hypothetical protein